MNKPEMVALCSSELYGLLAVGSQTGITLVDPKTPEPLADIAGPDGDYGVRSLEFCGHLLSCGGGVGRLSFFDVRKGWLSGRNGEPFLQSSPHWLTGSPTHHHGQLVTSAIYAHEWNADSVQLVCGGGPLMLSIQGFYSAVWC